MNVPHPAHARPQRTILDGRYARLVPVSPAHADNLFEAAGEERYTYLFGHKPESREAMAASLAKSAAADDPLVFAVIDKATGRAEGVQSLMRITPEHGVIEIGGILWGDRIARTRISTEALYLFARYSFDDLGYRRFEWKCNNRNEPSKRAAARFGFTYEGVFRQHMIIKGQNRDTAWFSMLDGEWPRTRAEYERWLDPANFGPGGEQQTKLAASLST